MAEHIFYTATDRQQAGNAQLRTLPNKQLGLCLAFIAAYAAGTLMYGAQLVSVIPGGITLFFNCAVNSNLCLFDLQY